MLRRAAMLAGTVACALGLVGVPARASAGSPASSGRSLAPGRLPDESPLYRPPPRRGLGLEVGVGVALCQPSLRFGGSCAPRGSSPASPGLGLRVGLGWRVDPWAWVGLSWARQTHRPGGGFTQATNDAGLIVARGVVPLRAPNGRDSRIDLGFELGLGMSWRRLDRDATPVRLSSLGIALRPAIVLEGWVLADLALGIELASQLDLHWQHCTELECRVTPSWLPEGLRHRFVDGFTIAVRATGSIFAKP